MIEHKSGEYTSRFRWKFILPALLWAAVILVVLCIPKQDVPSWSFFERIPFFDKWVHALLFGTLAGLLLFAFRRQQDRSRVQAYPLLFSLSISIIYGGFTELIQMLAGIGRQADLLDWMADIAGSTIGAALYFIGNSIFVKRKRI